MTVRFHRLLAAFCVMMGWFAMSNVACASTASIQPADWTAYKEKFIEDNGRVIDDANGHISHSEGQGYGLLLAFLAGNQPDFDRIWSFTRTELLLRDDGLAVWKWDPNVEQHVTDSNNASDGDLLIAYSLALAGTAWTRTDLTESARSLASALGKKAVFSQAGRLLIAPGVEGFSAADRADGPVVNLSYWVFEAFPVLAAIAPETDWAKVSADGLSLLQQSLMGPRKLPPDWLSLRARPRPAQSFPAEFGYNAVRIPLYLVRAGNRDPELLGALRAGMTTPDGAIAIVDIGSGNVVHANDDAGYRIIPALVSCVLDKTPLAEDIKTFVPTLYYPSTLHLLGLSYAASNHAECL